MMVKLVILLQQMWQQRISMIYTKTNFKETHAYKHYIEHDRLQARCH